MRGILLAAVLVAASAPLATQAMAAAPPVLGSYAFNYVDADYGGPTAPAQTFNIGLDSNVVAAGADQGAGARNAIRAQSDAWLNRVEIVSDASRGLVYGSALSFFAINQTVTGAPGSIAHISYTFGVDGTFFPGPAAHYLPPSVAPPQNLTFYLLAYRGTAFGTSIGTDVSGPFLYFDSSAGHNSFGLVPFENTLGAPFAAAAACFGMDTRCSDGGSFSDLRTISFDIATGEDYFVVGFLSGQTDGQANFFNTAKLQTIALAPEYGLISGDGGALVRAANGEFTLASVPEPASWAMLIAGFGLSGAAMRRQRVRATV